MPVTKKSGVSRFGCQETGVDAKQRQGLIIFVAKAALEHQIGINLAIQPVIVGQFVLDLARGPASITQPQKRVL